MSAPFDLQIPDQRIVNYARFEATIARFDSINREDHTQIGFQGETYPAEYFLAQALSRWILKLDPEPSEPLLLASRCQHLRRWERPRNSYPDGRVGYLNWRADLKEFHAQTVGEILEEFAYDEALRIAVRKLNLKTQLKDETDCQTLEDGLCLVFLEYQFQDLVIRHSENKIISILKKTAAKMSKAGLHAAVSLNYSEAERELLQGAALS